MILDGELTHSMLKSAASPSYFSYCLKSEGFIALCSTCYTAVQIKNCLKSTSVIKVATMKNTDDFCYTKEAITCNHQINAIHCQQR